MLEINYDDISKIIGYSFNDQSLLFCAFTHSSFAHQHGQKSNERLEFLGDAVLDFIVTEMLYSRDDAPEGDMSKHRAQLVSTSTLASIVSNIGIDKYLQVGDSVVNGEVTQSMREDLYEAIIGAIFLDGGMDCARDFINRTLNYNAIEDRDYKTKLQEIVQKAINVEPEYISSDAPMDNGEYITRLVINSVTITEQTGKSKKQSHMNCAKYALENIQLVKDALRR